eukprot:sb/3472723/
MPLKILPPPPGVGDIDTWCDPHCVVIALGGYVANSWSSPISTSTLEAKDAVCQASYMRLNKYTHKRTFQFFGYFLFVGGIPHLILRWGQRRGEGGNNSLGEPSVLRYVASFKREKTFSGGSIQKAAFRSIGRTSGTAHNLVMVMYHKACLFHFEKERELQFH